MGQKAREVHQIAPLVLRQLDSLQLEQCSAEHILTPDKDAWEPNEHPALEYCVLQCTGRQR